MKQDQLNKLGLNLSEDWNVSDLILASRNGYLEGFSEDQLDKLSVLNEAITEYIVSIPVNSNVQITNSDIATFYLYPLLKNLDHEECYILYLSIKNTIIKRMRLSMGSLTQTTFDSKQILRNAILLGAQGIIISHNHPTNDPMPSPADIHATKTLEKACNTVGIQLLDHIIISNSTYYSFTEDRHAPYAKEVLEALSAA